MAGKIAYKASHRRVEWANITTVNPQSDHRQYTFNTMVNAISHHSHPRSIHSQSTVNATTMAKQRQNNPQTTLNNP
jgi:hypothetical protein